MNNRVIVCRVAATHLKQVKHLAPRPSPEEPGSSHQANADADECHGQQEHTVRAPLRTWLIPMGGEAPVHKVGRRESRHAAPARVAVGAQRMVVELSLSPFPATAGHGDVHTWIGIVKAVIVAAFRGTPTHIPGNRVTPVVIVVIEAPVAIIDLAEARACAVLHHETVPYRLVRTVSISPPRQAL